MSSEIKANKWSPATGTAATLGDSSDTFTVPSGVTLDIASGATIANSGTATGFGGENTPAFLAKFASSGSQTITDNTVTKIEMSQEIYDSGSTYDPTTNYRWTPGVVGKYLIGFSVYNEDNEIIRATGYLYMNGSVIYSNHGKVIEQGTQTAWCTPRWTWNGQSIVDVTDAADYFEVYIWIDTYDSGTAAVQDQNHTYFWGHRLII